MLDILYKIWDNTYIELNKNISRGLKMNYLNNKACSDECEETQYELQAKYSNMNK